MVSKKNPYSTLEDPAVAKERVRPRSVLLIKLGALVSFCGGPLLVTEELKAHFADPFPFILAFVPVGILALGALTLRDGVESGIDRFFLRLGRVSAFGLLALDVYSTARLIEGVGGKDRGLLVFGTIVGVGVAFAYLRAAKITLSADSYSGPRSR